MWIIHFLKCKQTSSYTEVTKLPSYAGYYITTWKCTLSSHKYNFKINVLHFLPQLTPYCQIKLYLMTSIIYFPQRWEKLCFHLRAHRTKKNILMHNDTETAEISMTEAPHQWTKLRTAAFWVTMQPGAVISYWYIRTTCRPHLRFSWPSTSVRNCHYSLRNNPEQPALFWTMLH